jgi:hypothetical protein
LVGQQYFAFVLTSRNSGRKSIWNGEESMAVCNTVSIAMMTSKPTCGSSDIPSTPGLDLSRKYQSKHKAPFRNTPVRQIGKSISSSRGGEQIKDVHGSLAVLKRLMFDDD